MKLAIFFVVVIAAVSAAPQGDPSQAQILRYDNDNIGINGYSFGFDSSDGTSRQEQAQLKNIGTENEALEVRGTISWVAPDGQQYKIDFIADENGYRPSGAHLPQA